jgi:adenylate cyclase
MSPLKNLLIGLASGLFFALLYATGVLEWLEDRVYDAFLKGKLEKERISNVVFLDVDDPAIAFNGVFPWPRSIMADGFLRLKEYGVRAAILDIEFIDKGPPGIDSIYFERDFPMDCRNTFEEIGGSVEELLGAVQEGRLNRAETEAYGNELLSFITGGGEALLERASGIARDNDVYLAQTSALFGRTWATLNLQPQPLSGEQAERRPLAEEKFSYPVTAAPGAYTGDNVDILPALPSFSQAARGAGYTNVHIDRDGVRRRIFLVQNVAGYNYLQLAFAPLMEYLGYPNIRLETRRLILEDVRIADASATDAADTDADAADVAADAAGATDATDATDAAAAEPASGSTRNIVIPLDSGGRMMLDWPKTDFPESFTHVSFEDFSRLEQLEFQIEQYLAELEKTQVLFFAQFDETIGPATSVIYQGGALLRQSRDALSRALAEQSDEHFQRRLALRDEGMALLHSFAEFGLPAKLLALAEEIGVEYPEDATAIQEEAAYIAQLAGYLETAERQHAENQAKLREIFTDKFCIIGRVDTGTTDIGVNPFYSKYINVGTHGAVLDTILRESFITPLSSLWRAVLSVVFSVFLMLVLAGMKPVTRILSGVGGAVFFGVFSFVLFRYSGIFIGPLGPVLAAIVAIVFRELVSYSASEKEKQFINKALSTYVSKEVAAELVANPALLQLGGSRRQMSAIFTDIQGFSTIAEQLDPEQLVQLLNRYLTEMSDIIMENMGTIDKYEGDAIIAFFGAPVYREDHAVMACRSAVKMKKVEAELNRIIITDKLSPRPLFTRIGINTGEMVVGNMGTSNKMNYTVMGNAVNLAARLEGVNKQYHTGGILISEYTKNAIGDEFVCRSLDRVRVVGIHTPVRLYELLGLRDDTGQAALPEDWETAMARYEKKEFQAAAEIFSSIAARREQDGAARLYMEKCLAYIADPPPDDWDGVNNLIEK